MPGKTLDISQVPEVKAYQDAVDLLQEFKRQHANVFQTYFKLLEDRNQKMQLADKAVRAQGISCGDWERYQDQTKYNPQALYEALGRDGFLNVGGALQTVTTFSVDKSKLEAAAARGEVPPGVMEQVKTISPRYHAPKETDL